MIGLICQLFIPLILMAPRALLAQGSYGTTVVSVEIDGAPLSVLEDFPIATGSTLTPEAVRSAIQTLYDRGGYGRIEVEAVSSPAGGTGLIFHVDDPYFFGSVRIEPAGLLERSLSAYMSLPYGERFSRTRLDAIVATVGERLEAEGYFDAGITPAYTRDEVTRLVAVTLRVQAGPPARIGGIRFEGGEQTFGSDELADAFRVSSGDPFLEDRIREGEESLRALFASLEGRAGFLDTSIDVRQTWNPGVNTVDLVVGIEPGTFAFVDVRGSDLSDERLRELVPVFEEGSVDDDLIEEGRINLLEYLRRQGYFQATVTTPEEPIRVPLEPDNPDGDVAIQIIYDVDPGERYTVTAVRLAGNEFFADDVIHDEIGLSSRGIFSRGVFSPELMEEAEDTIRRMYAAAGFSGTQVQASSEIEGNGITVTIDISEGEQLLVSRIAVTGNTVLSDDEVILAGDVFGGEVFRFDELDQARRAVTTRYHSLGYADARVLARLTEDDQSYSVDIVYEIEEGDRFEIGRIVVAGNTRTRTTVIRRHADLTEADPYDPEAILEAQRSLYATGLFNRVEIVTLDQDRQGRRDLLIQIEDASPLLLTYGVGIEQGIEEVGGPGRGVDVRGTVEISHTNLWGLDRSLSARIRGSKSEQSFQTTYREPRLFNWNVDGFASLFVERTETPQVDFSRIDFSLQTLYQFPNLDNLLLTASFQTVNLRDIRVNPRADISDEEGTIQIATVGGSWIRDTRNDPINPSRGNYISATLQVGNRAYGSEVNFTSLFTQFSLYRPAKQSVLAGSVRIGWNHPYGTTRTLPITERYFAGGSTTLRAFGVDEAGPEGGGNALFLLNLEYRYPIPFLLSGLGAALFYDTGTIFPRMSDFSVGDFTHTAGLGLRYQTPVGPIRVDFGMNLNRQPAESANELHFTLGHAF